MATAVSPSRVEAVSGHSGGFHPPATDDARNALPSPCAIPVAAVVAGGGQNAGAPQSWPFCFAGGISGAAPVGTANGAFLLPTSGGWAMEASRQTSPAPYLASFENACYNHNGNNNNGAPGKTVYVSSVLAPYHPSVVRFSSGTGSDSSIPRNGVYSTVGPTDFTHGTGASCTTPFVSCDSSPSASVSRRLINNNAGGGCSNSAGLGKSVMGSNSVLDAFPISSLNNTSSVAPSTPLYSTMDGVERLRLQPLRFKMLPSPVPYEMLFADNLLNPSPGRLARYQAIMVRWYNHILVAQENARARVRQRCPPPPDPVLQQANTADPAELRSWSAHCCRWWEETSRRRTRRGHRGGKTLANGGATRSAGQQQQKAPSHAGGGPHAMPCELPLSSNAFTDEESNINWDQVIENIIDGDE